jgi:hypothetical protein
MGEEGVQQARKRAWCGVERTGCSAWWWISHEVSMGDGSDRIDRWYELQRRRADNPERGGHTGVQTRGLRAYRQTFEWRERVKSTTENTKVRSCSQDPALRHGAFFLRVITPAMLVLLPEYVLDLTSFSRLRPEVRGPAGAWRPPGRSGRSGSVRLIFPSADPTLEYSSGERPGFLGGNCVGLIHPEWRTRPVAFQALHPPLLRSLQKTCHPIMPRPTRRPISTVLPVFS